MDARIHKLFLQLRNTSPGIPSPFSTENHRYLLRHMLPGSVRTIFRAYGGFPTSNAPLSLPKGADSRNYIRCQTTKGICTQHSKTTSFPMAAPLLCSEPRPGRKANYFLTPAPFYKYGYGILPTYSALLPAPTPILCRKNAAAPRCHVNGHGSTKLRSGAMSMDMALLSCAPDSSINLCQEKENMALLWATCQKK